MVVRLAVGLAKPALFAVGVGTVLTLAGVDVVGMAWSLVDSTATAALDWLTAQLADHLTVW